MSTFMAFSRLDLRPDGDVDRFLAALEKALTSDGETGVIARRPVK